MGRGAGAVRSSLAVAVVALLVLLLAGIATNRLMNRQRTIPAPPDSEIELTLNHEGTTYKHFRGDVYTVG